MLKSVITLLLFLPIVLVFQSTVQADISQSKDHQLLPRFAGSEIVGYKTSDYDSLTFALGPAYEESPRKYKLRKEQSEEGQITRILYLCPAEKSTLQVFRNYEKYFAKAGFKNLYTCTGDKECGYHAWFTGIQTLGGLREYALQLRNDFRYLSSRLSRDEGDVYVSLLVYKYTFSGIKKWHKRTMVELNVVEIEPMKEEIVHVKAEELAKGIEAEGHAAVHQIHFDLNSDSLQPESFMAIKEIAKFLHANPDMKIFLVGHTDNQGDLKYNMDLSQRRAQAVITALEAEFGIAHKRLEAAGLGYLAPIASNRTEAGRAKNRRVELVER